MTTPTFTRQTAPVMFVRDGETLVPVPDEDAVVLARYRDSMPLVFEPQYSGDAGLYPLVDEDEDPCGVPVAGTLERLARATAAHLRGTRHGRDLPAPDLDRLARAAVDAYLTDVADFAAAVHGDDNAGYARAVDVAASALRAEISRTARKYGARQ